MNDIHINIGVTGVCCSIWLSWRDLNKGINATVNIFIFSFIYFFPIDFDSPGVHVKNKHISQLHSISLLHFFLNAYRT